MDPIASFPPASPHHPAIDPAMEEHLRELHASLAVTFASAAEHRLDPIRLERRGFACIPSLVVPITAKERDVKAMIDTLRQHAFGYLAERGVDNHHLRFVPTVSVGRRTKFISQTGAARMGEQCEVWFELSRELASLVEWSGRYGTLKAAWERDSA